MKRFRNFTTATAVAVITFAATSASAQTIIRYGSTPNYYSGSYYNGTPVYQSTPRYRSTPTYQTPNYSYSTPQQYSSGYRGSNYRYSYPSQQHRYQSQPYQSYRPNYGYDPYAGRISYGNQYYGTPSQQRGAIVGGAIGSAVGGQRAGNIGASIGRAISQ